MSDRADHAIDDKRVFVTGLIGDRWRVRDVCRQLLGPRVDPTAGVVDDAGDVLVFLEFMNPVAQALVPRPRRR